MHPSRYVFLTALLASLSCLSALQAADHVKDTQVALCRSLLGKEIRPGLFLGATQIFTSGEVASQEQRDVASNPYCRIEGRIEAEPGSEIGFEIWLPSADTWNERLLAVGSGGSMGWIDTVDLAEGVSRGFAATATDDGHKQQRSSENTWAYQRPARVRDFGGRALHLTTLAAKAAIRIYYEKPLKYAYFNGYSRGGASGLVAAQRYPEDFDGVLAGAPPYSWALEMVMQAWNLRALTRTPESGLSAEEFQSLNAAVTRECAGPDGLIADPRDCRFDPASLRCPAAESGFCLSDAQVAAIRDMYRGPHDSRGRPITRGLTRGGEFAWGNLWDVGTLGVDNAAGSWLGVWRYLVFEDPTWTLERIDFDRDPQFAENRMGPLFTQNDPDLSAFAGHGGRMIVYHGWADDMAPAEPSVDYHAAVVEQMGREAADEVLRLFMIPGMAHSPTGPNPGAGGVNHTVSTRAVPLEPGRDMLMTLQRWVEDGIAPESFVATGVGGDGGFIGTRLLCAEPAIARYAGEGDTRNAANWNCTPRESHR